MDQRRQKISGFTLVELTISLGMAAVLMFGLGSAIMLAVHAVPSGQSAVQQAAVAVQGIDLLTTELYYAQSFTRLSANSISFTVAPRGSDTQPETITYSWSGVAGAPLMRQYNNGAPQPVVSNVNSFVLGFNKRAVTYTQNVTTTSTTSEQLISSLLSPGGLLPSYQSYAASSVNQISQYIPNSASPPTGATTLNITRVCLDLASVSGGGANFTVALYKPGSAPTPSGSLFAAPVSLPSSVLASSYQWININFSNASTTKLNQDFCVVVSAPTSASSVYVQYMTSLLGNATNSMETSNNSGGNWSGPGLLSAQIVPYYCYGTWTTTTVTQQQVTDYYLQSAGITLQAGSDAADPINTNVEIYAQPKVTGL